MSTTATTTTTTEATAEQDRAMKEAQQRQAEVDMMEKTLIEMRNVSEEHKRVLKQIAPLDGQRTAYRHINGVLVQTNVENALKELEANVANFEERSTKLREELKSKHEALNKHMQEHGLRFASKQQMEAARRKAAQQQQAAPASEQ